MLYISLFVSMILCGYLAIRLILLQQSIRQITKDVQMIQQDYHQNQILHLPIPNKQLQELLCAFNCILETTSNQSQQYESREHEFQKQIETISHDLRTPLTVILGYLKLLHKKQEILEASNEEFDSIIQTIKRKAETMHLLVEQFYAYSRLKTGNYEITLEQVDVSRLLRESLLGNYQALDQAKILVDAQIPAHPIWVYADPSSLERIFMNLYQNVERYAKSKFQIRIVEASDHILIHFINDTSTVRERDLPYLFERFYMENQSRNQGGTGLGLTVAKSLAEGMNGSLSVKCLETATLNEQEPLSLCFELSLRK